MRNSEPPTGLGSATKCGLIFFSGSNQGVTSDAVPSGQFDAPSLGGQMLAAGYSFVGYSEDLPSVGFTGSKSGDYTRGAPAAALEKAEVRIESTYTIPDEYHNPMEPACRRSSLSLA